MGFIFNKNNNNVRWEDSEAGKQFKEKCIQDAIRRKEENEKWERETPPERKEQYKLFKIFFTIFFLSYFVFLVCGFLYYKELFVLLCEFIFSMISLLLFFIKPKKVKYPNCFMMPVIAFGCTILMYISLGVSIFGFNPKIRSEYYKTFKQTQNTEDVLNYEKKESEIKFSIELPELFGPDFINNKNNYLEHDNTEEDSYGFE